MAQKQNVRNIQNDKNIFVSWGGDEAQQVGSWVKENILDPLPGYKTFISMEITSGENFVERIHTELDAADEAIAVMTDVALDRPWFLYEIAYLRGKRLRNFPLLRLGPKLPAEHPLYTVHAPDGFEFKNLMKFVECLLSGEDEKVKRPLLQSLTQKSQEWKDLTEPIRRKNERTAGLREATAAAIDGILKSKRSGNILSHSCTMELARKTLNDLATAFHGLQDQTHPTYRIDYRRYPEYLMHLQKELDATTQAIAIVDDVEEFWAHKTGDAILETTNAGSRRVFVFENSKLFSKYFRQVLRHAEKYPVYVMTSKEFGRVRHRVTRDFSVITAKNGDQITAFYDNAAASIQFTTDRHIVAQKLSIFEDVVRWGHQVETPHQDAAWVAYEKEMCKLIFSTSDHTADGNLHSTVIPIELYDAFEEDHPFYQEMHEIMLHEFRQRVADATAGLSVLEIGAGTGLFTKRLAQQPFAGMTIKAMEPDNKAHPLLHRKLQSKANRVQPILASILTYDPRGEFRFIFSSFSEHHIRPEDKDQYFSVVTGTMESGGYLIIGDEFLAPSCLDSPEAYDDALNRYHEYIIDLAIKSHHSEVAALERLAMESGRPTAQNRIDFKMSLAWYKDKASRAGLILEAEHCVTPAELAPTIGGIHVLVYKKP
jgi:SAM-dependent methyltransferase